MTDTQRNDREDRITAWVLGELPADDARRFAAEIAADPTLAAEVRAAEEALAAFATAAPVPPPPELRARVLATVAPAARPVGARIAPWLGLGLAASVALALWQQRDLDALREERDALAARAASLASTVAERDSLVARLTDPRTTLVTLAATGEPAPRVRLLLDRIRGVAVLSASSLEPLPAEQSYQLWFIVGGVPVPSTTFTPGADGEAILASVSVPSEGRVDAVAVTREPAGGSATPTMPILFVGSVGTE